MRIVARLFHRLLEIVSVSLLLLLAVIVVIAVVARYILNDSLPWYDEVASVLLAWITYFGAALAVQKRAHMGFGGILVSLPMTLRILAFVVAEAVVYGVFVVLAWAGWQVLAVMEGMALESLPWASMQVVQGVIPLGCGLVVLAQLASTGVAFENLKLGRDVDQREIETEIARAEAEIARGSGKEV